MKNKKITAKIYWHNEFGFITTDFKVQPKETKEDTFKEILNTIPKKTLKTWESISFEDIEVRKDWLIETNFDFSKSYQGLVD